MEAEASRSGVSVEVFESLGGSECACGGEKNFRLIQFYLLVQYPRSSPVVLFSLGPPVN